jgi:hypothetical protein
VSLTSASTDAQVLAQFEDSYRSALGKSESAILDCLEALGYLRLRIPQGGQFAGRAFSKYAIDDLEKRLAAMLEAAQASSGTARGRRVKLRLDGVSDGSGGA